MSRGSNPRSGTGTLRIAGVAIAIASALSAGLAAGLQTTNDGVFTAEQVTLGEAVYQRKCATCHGDDLVGADRFPALVGEGFFDKWIGGDLNTFVDRLRSMPADAPASLTDAEYVQVAAFILNANGIKPGSTPLPTEAAALKAITIQKRK